MKFSSVLSVFAALIAIVGPVYGGDTICDPISKYTTEVCRILDVFELLLTVEMQWFLANTKPEWRTRSFDSTALFYSSGLSARAKEFARQANKVTIWVRLIPISPCTCLFHPLIRARINRRSGHARTISLKQRDRTRCGASCRISKTK
jgi:hypothetical protein